MVVICCYLETEHYEVMKFRVNNFAYFENYYRGRLLKEMPHVILLTFLSFLALLVMSCYISLAFGYKSS